MFSKNKAQGGPAQGDPAQGGHPLGGGAQGGGAQGDGSKTKELRVGMWNAHSMQHKMEKINSLIHHDDKQFDVFVIVESWLGQVVPDGIKIEGYTHLNYPGSSGTQGGGILIYMHDTLAFTEKQSYEGYHTNIQYAAVSITAPVQLDLVAVYRPPRNPHWTLYELLGSYLSSLNTETGNVVVLGDFNIDLNPKGWDPKFCEDNKEFLRDPYLLDEYIRRPTFRRSLSYIDHIYYSRDRELRIIDRGVIKEVITDTDDHFPIFCVLGNSELDFDLFAAGDDDEEKPSPLFMCQYKNCAHLKITNQEQLNLHYNQQHHICPLPCNKTFEKEPLFKKHQRACLYRKSTNCHFTTCKVKKDLGSREELTKHYKENHWICPLPCHAYFLNEKNFLKHQEDCKFFKRKNSGK